MYLTQWDDSIHELPEQQTRRDRARSERMSVTNINRKEKSGTVQSGSGSIYHVTTTACSCPDFEKRGLPCKHMYALDDVLTPSRKNKKVALWLAILLGWLGIHRFYVGKVGSGVLWLFTVGMFFFGWVVDIIQIAAGRFTDKDGRILADPEA